MSFAKEVIIRKKVLQGNQSFRVAYEETSDAEIIFIKVVDKKGNYGLGAIACDTHVTGEKIRDVFKILNKRLTKDFFDLPFEHWYQYHQKIQKVFHDYLSAQFGVEDVILNLFSKQTGVPLCKLFGNYRDSVDLIFSVGIKDIKSTENQVKNKIKDGFQILKIKVGEDVDEDINKIKLIRKIIPAKCKITLDANRGYSFNEAKRLFKAINGLNISLIEEPLAKKDITRLKQLRAFAKMPIIADESTVTIRSAINMLLDNNWDGVNIKLINCGGPINFLKIFHLAKVLNKIIMIGCTSESNISMTAGANLALGLPIDYVDLDSGHLDFPNDPAIGGMLVKKGKITIGSPLKLGNL